MIKWIKKYLLKRRLRKFDESYLKDHNYDGITTYAKVVSTYDGDTFRIVFEYKGEMIRLNCRLLGVDCPELRTKNPKEKKAGIKSKWFVQRLITYKVFKVELGKFDKYGRVLINVFINKTTLTEMIIKNGYGVAYNGGTKNKIIYK